MTKYSRAEFRSWLASLPQDKPFCQPCVCPVRTYLEAHGCKKVDANPVMADGPLTRAIDHYGGRHDRGWHELYPRDVIAIIDELESKA